MDDLGTFVNIMTDFGFKRLFGTEDFKNVLIRFLNTLFAEEGVVVTDVTYHDKEVLPQESDGKRIVYDVYCTTPTQKEHFILEMQQIYHAHFEKRALFYLAKGVASQGRKGSRYDYSPVFGIFFVDFQMSHLDKMLLHDFLMMEAKTHKVFSNLMRLMIVCLKETKPTWEDCKTELEKTTYLIKNMHLMDKESKAYKCGEFNEMFEAAEIGNFAKEDIVAYKQSKRYYEDQILYREAAIDEGMAKGIAKGIAEGRVEGRAKGILESAQKMLKAGFSPEEIERILGVSPFGTIDSVSI